MQGDSGRVAARAVEGSVAQRAKLLLHILRSVAP